MTFALIILWVLGFALAAVIGWTIQGAMFWMADCLEAERNGEI